MPIVPDIPSNRKTRIIATLGPATSSEEMVSKILLAGVNVIRLNMSHGTHEQHRDSFNVVRKVAKRLKREVPVFCDLCGPKIRVGRLQDGEINLKSRAQVVVTTRGVIGRDGLIPCQYRNLHKDVEAGHRILLDDGKLELKVVSVQGRDIECRVIYGGILKDKKGINLPDSHVSSSSLTANDRKDVLFAQKMGADLIALSFVRTADDILQLKKYMKRHGKAIPVIAKIEKPEALDNFNDILKVSYAIMVARGDLGIEIDAARVPMVQRDLITRARQACRPVIVATQMMESMISDSRPTRAEVGDVSNAAFYGADAVMLSGETSVGKYPVQAVKYMHHILLEMESWQTQNVKHVPDVDMRIAHTPRRALAHAAIDIANDLDLMGMFLPTSSGTTAGVMASFRPTVPFYGICLDQATARRLMLHWGVRPIIMADQHTNNWEHMIRRIARKTGLKLKTRSVVVLAGFGKGSENNQPVLKILRF